MEMIKEAGVNMITEAGVMFGEATAAAVLGPACEGLLKSIKKCWMFDDPVLDSVKSTVENLEPWIPKMEDHNMKLGGRQDEVKELKEEMERGRRLLDKLSEVNDLSWFKTSSYNDQLVALDASLKSLVRKLRLQLATDVKEVLVLEKETAKVVKGTKRKLFEVDETVKAGFLGSQTRDEVLLNKMEKLERKLLGNQVEQLNEGAALVDALGELDDVAQEEIARLSLYDWSSMKDSYNDWCMGRLRLIKRMTNHTFKLVEKKTAFGLLEKKTAENKVMVYIPVGEVRDFRMKIMDGVNLLRNCPEVAVWTDELKLEYTNKFTALEETLEALHNRLAAIRPLQWNCGTTSIQDSAIKTTKDFIIHGN